MLARAAAMLVMMVGAGWLIYTATDNGDVMTVASAEKVLKHTLPDGTTVTLNKNSTISYAGHFDGEKRSVTLSGEAFFDVTPDKSRPFVIDAGNSSVTVVGTTFNVKSRKDITEVIVESGVVEVAKKQYFVRLKPGERATVSPDNDAPVASRTTDSLYNYYRTNEFICDGIPLSKLMNTLSEVYEVKVEIKNARLATLPINTVLSTNNLDEILDVISRTFREQLTIDRKGNTIIIRSAQ
jgi:ferric-dicitrate binding protein FerR (iron transport regulator)